MMKLTAEERKRMHVAQQAARQAMLDRVLAAPQASQNSPSWRRRHLVGAAIVMTLLGTGLLLFQSVEFHVPTSLEAFLPPS